MKRFVSHIEIDLPAWRDVQAFDLFLWESTDFPVCILYHCFNIVTSKYDYNMLENDSLL